MDQFYTYFQSIMEVSRKDHVGGVEALTCLSFWVVYLC